MHNYLKLKLLAAATLMLFSCGQKAVNGTYTDDYGRVVEVPDEPKRIVSTSPAVTEIMFALGADDLLVGRTDFCAYPAEATRIPSIGGISNLNVERILSLNPDLVISGSMVPAKKVEQMEGMGVPMACVIEKPHFDAIYDNISRIGLLTGHEAEADSLNEALRAKVAALGEPTGEPKTCYYVVGFGAAGNFTAGGNTFINDIIRLSGGRNIAEGIDGWSYSLEALMKEDPEYIIIRREDSASFVATQPYSTLRAVRQGNVIAMESGMIDLQVPRNVDAVLYLRQRFFLPE